jgi:hypothetical protein
LHPWRAPIFLLMGSDLKVLHDRLLSEQPDGAVHDPDDCPLCDMEETNPMNDPEGGDVGSFTQEQLDAAVAKAVAEATGPLTQRIEELSASAKETEVGKAISDALAPKEAEIADLQSKLDAAEARATKAETEFTDFKAAAEAKEKEDEENKAREARKGDRVKAMKDAKVFSDTYVDENADRFAAMSDEDFAARMEEWKAVTASKGEGGEGGGEKIPEKTGLQAAREGSGNGNLPTGSLLGELGSLRGALSDPRTI